MFRSSEISLIVNRLFDRATPMKLTNAVAFVRPSKHVEQISHSLASCSNLLLKCFERNHKRCSDPQKFP